MSRRLKAWRRKGVQHVFIHLSPVFPSDGRIVLLLTQPVSPDRYPSCRSALDPEQLMFALMFLMHFFFSLCVNAGVTHAQLLEAPQSDCLGMIVLDRVLNEAGGG